MQQRIPPRAHQAAQRNLTQRMQEVRLTHHSFERLDQKFYVRADSKLQAFRVHAKKLARECPRVSSIALATRQSNRKCIRK